MDKHLGVDLLEALRHHSGTVIGGDRIGEVFVEHRGLMAWAADEIAALRAELDGYKAEKLRREQAQSCDGCIHNNERAEYPCSDCGRYNCYPDHYEAARAALEGGQANG